VIKTLIVILLAILATYRLARLISQDTILDTLREMINRKASELNSLWYWVAEWMNCAHCVGVWIAFFMMIALSFYFHWRFLEAMLIWLAIAGGQSYLWSMVEGNYEEE
jgi:hypothetical protein